MNRRCNNWNCRANLANETAIGGRLGYICIQCYGDGEITAELFQKTIANRHCYKCNRDLKIEPAIINPESRKLICFPCQLYRDRANDEANEKEFEAESRVYENQFTDWRSRSGVKWIAQQKTLEKIKNGIKNCVNFLIFVSVLFILVLLKDGEPGSWKLTVVLICTVLTAYLFAVPLAEDFLSALFDKFGCRPPPEKRVRQRALSACPELLFDCNSESDLNWEFVNFRFGYPPDWEERRKKCLTRDEYCCRLCGSHDGELHAHHVIPISYRGNHGLQNLITLCKQCHINQEYYGHKELIKKYDLGNSELPENSDPFLPS